MKTFPILKRIMTVLLLFFSIIINAQTDKPLIVPEIKYDNAMFSGKISGLMPADSIFQPITLILNNIVTAEDVSYVVPIEKDGTFSQNIPVQCISFTGVMSEYYNQVIFLIPGEETRLEISYDKNNEIEVKLMNSIGYSAEDAINMEEVGDEALDNMFSMENEVLSSENYSLKYINLINESVQFIEDSDKLSSAGKQLTIAQTKLWVISSYLLDYVNTNETKYMAVFNVDSVPKEFKSQMPEKSYYSFLKSLNFSNPVNFSSRFYSSVLQSLLSNDTLAIPRIGDMPVSTWLTITKEILNDIISPDAEEFYDLFAGNSYAKQLNEMNPFSEIQKKNIESYFKNKSYVSILLDENEKVLKLASNKIDSATSISNNTSLNLMDSILAKYKGSVIFVDFWATWCMPCIAAMNESESVKKEFVNEKVVFVYIADPTSTRKTWAQKTTELGGEHHFATEEEWAYLKEFYNFTPIPHYLIFDKKGVLNYNKVSFMGNEEMTKLIQASLNDE